MFFTGLRALKNEYRSCEILCLGLDSNDGNDAFWNCINGLWNL